MASTMRVSSSAIRFSTLSWSSGFPQIRLSRTQNPFVCMYVCTYTRAIMRRTTSRSRRTSADQISPAKTRITIRIDADVLDWFRRQAGASGGYQPLVNRALRDYIDREPLEATLRRVIREELARAGLRKTPHGYDDEASLPRALVADSGGAAGEYGDSLRRPRPDRRRRRNRRDAPSRSNGR